MSGLDAALNERHERTATLERAIGEAILDAVEPTGGGDEQRSLAVVQAAVEAETVSRELLRRSVHAARSHGHSWADVGRALGMSRQAAQQRFGGEGADDTDGAEGETRWLGPVTAFDEMGELELAGQRGWHTIGAGMLKHKVVRTPTQWEHKRIVWSASIKRYERDGWQIGCRAFPWIYLIRDTGVPVAED